MSIFRNVTLPDDKTLLRAASEALTHPPDSAFGDPDLFVTWGLTIGTHRDDDLIGTSNFERISADMFKVFPADAKDQMSNDWGHGWRDEMAVRVIEPWADPDDYTVRDITRAFAVIVSIATSLREQYPVYDDSDYVEREHEEEMKNKEENWRDVYWRLGMDYDVDEPTEADRASFDEFWRDSWDSTGEPWVNESEAAEKIMVRRWAGFTAENARAW
jgi:hypothetical protein